MPPIVPDPAIGWPSPDGTTSPDGQHSNLLRPSRRQRPVTATLSLKLALANRIGTLARLSGRGGGSSLPGRTLTRLAPQAVTTLGARLPSGSSVISATNGKTTTAAMAVAMLRAAGISIVHNHTGANMSGGIATSLASASRLGGHRLRGELGVFEVDELWLDRLCGELDPHHILLSNLFRDQLDRYGELEAIAARWSRLAMRRADSSRFLACADDPRVAAIARHSAHPLYFGIDDDRIAEAGLQHASDPAACEHCDIAHTYRLVYLAHLGDWQCEHCGDRRPPLDIAAHQVTLRGSSGSTFTLRTPQGSARINLPLPGLYNIYNALAATALASALGAPFASIVTALDGSRPSFGRAERLALNGRPVTIFLVKNPAGANEVVRTLALDDAPIELYALLNDKVADGRDVSWVWDVDWEVISPLLANVTLAGSRGADLGVRLKHAGVPTDRLRLIDSVADGLDAALAAGSGPLYILPTYTAMLELHQVLAQRGIRPRYWQTS